VGGIGEEGELSRIEIIELARFVLNEPRGMGVEEMDTQKLARFILRAADAQLFIIDFDERSDGGPRRVGPFTSRGEANRYVDGLREWRMDTDGKFTAVWTIVPIAPPDDQEQQA
jgi:hypothetical protein